MQEEKRLAAEKAAARLRARDITERLSAQTAEKARKASAEPDRVPIPWRSLALILLVVIVLLVLGYAGIRILAP